MLCVTAHQKSTSLTLVCKKKTITAVEAYLQLPADFSQSTMIVSSLAPFITVEVLTSLSTLQAQVTDGLDLEVSSVGEVKNKTGERLPWTH